MPTTVAQMTKEELSELVELAVEKKLLEMLQDPEEGLELRSTVRDRLLHQQQAVATGERGGPLEEVTQELGIIGHRRDVYR
jgi:hypothetical protein